MHSPGIPVNMQYAGYFWMIFMFVKKSCFLGVQNLGQGSFNPCPFGKKQALREGI